MQNDDDIKVWAEHQIDDQWSKQKPSAVLLTADDKRRKKLTSLMREFSKRLPTGLTVEEAAEHPLNRVMFDIFDELQARYIDIETLEGSMVTPELLNFVAQKVGEDKPADTGPSGDFDKNGHLV